MKTIKTLLAGALMMFSASAMAQATYETADGTKTSVAVTDGTITIADGQLTMGGQTFSLSEHIFCHSYCPPFSESFSLSGLFLSRRSI